MRSRYQHILVPVDFGPRNQWAVDVAIEVAQVNSSRVTLLHVVESIDSAAEDMEIQEFLQRCAQRAEVDLERYAQPFADIGLAVDYHVVIGRRVAEVINWVDAHAVDLVILSSHPVDPEQPAQSLATLSYQVALGAPCSVFLVKTPASDQTVDST